MRIATWNVNSIKPRLPRLLPWLDERRPHVVCLQETKLTDEAFSELMAAELAERGYEFAHHGQGQWNGVAILSRVGVTDVEFGFANQPDFAGRAEARAISANCAGMRIHSLYVPNGRDLESDHYAYKLMWLTALAQSIGGADDLILCGDMNVAPTDQDVFDPAAYVGHTHVTQPERERIAALGLVDVVREHWPDKQRVFSYWDYRAGMFHRDLGMRIDLILTTPPIADRVAAAWVDRHARKGTGPSDHAPVIVDLDDAPEGNIGPVVPPASNPATPRRRARLPQSAPVEPPSN